MVEVGGFAAECANQTKFKIVKYSKLSIVAKHKLIEKKLKDTSDGPLRK